VPLAPRDPLTSDGNGHGHRALLAGVLLRALEDVRARCVAYKPGEFPAVDWVRSDRTDHPFAFRCVCEASGWTPGGSGGRSSMTLTVGLPARDTPRLYTFPFDSPPSGPASWGQV
jgi:hypothetical protein